MALKKEENKKKGTEFEKEYAKLNPEQKKAVDHIYGPVMVIAGPGTGKTTVLTLRIANIINNGVSAQNILALTFTESAAANIREKLLELVGSEGYYVNINTFHGFANGLIQDYPQYFQRIIEAENATDAKQIAILRKIIDKGDFKKLKPMGKKYAYISDIKKAISDLKNEKYSPENFVQLLEKKRGEVYNAEDLYNGSGKYKGQMKSKYVIELERLERNKELAVLYKEYEDELHKENLYDYSDMILEAIKSLEENKAFLAEVQEMCRWVLVDEHQDTNRSQNALVELVSGFNDPPNIFAVGDEKQAIFRFQGASLENFSRFSDEFKNTESITLERNYRSTQPILDSAHSLIKNNRANISEKNLKAESNEAGEKIKIAVFDSAEAETAFVVGEAERLMKEGVKPKEIAVIYRENKDAGEFMRAFRRRGVPAVVRSDENILKDEKIRKLIALFRAVEFFGDDPHLIRVLHLSFLEIDPLDAYKILAAADSRKKSSVYSIISSEEKMKEIGIGDPGRLRKLYSNLRRWKKDSKNKNFLEFFEELVRESGFYADISSSGGYLDELGKLKAIFREAKKEIGSKWEYGLTDFTEHLEVLEEHNIPINVRVSDAADAVRLMTAHKAKGLQFDAVFIVNAVDKKWGNKRNLDKIKLPLETPVDVSELDKNEDERRVFYMAMTRARRHVFITYSRHSTDGRDQSPSQFIDEIGPEFREKIDAGKYESDADNGLAVSLSGNGSEPAFIAPTKDEVKKLFMSRGFPVTHLNNYLRCPWRYFYLDLLRVPRVMTGSQVYGTCVHAGLEEFFKKLNAGEKPDSAAMLAGFVKKLKKQPISSDEKEWVLKRGRETLPKYCEQHDGRWNGDSVTEYSVTANLTGEIRLAGRLDRLEHIKDGEVRVIDYKTSKPKSENEIRGLTKNSSGDQFRQLVFYKLLLELDPRHQYRMNTGVIDFVQPDGKGKFIQREISVSEEQVEQLKALILEKAGEIMNLEFWNKTCGEPDCEFCGLRSLMAADNNA